jgi:hypothetical protein
MEMVQGLWICEAEDRLSNLERLCINSFLNNGHDFHLYSYQELTNLPIGVVSHDANEILPEDQIWRTDNGSLAGFADTFRYKLLYEKGGWWVDLDAFCYKPFDFKDALVFSSEEGREEYEGMRLVNGGVMKVPPKHPSMKKALETSEKFGNGSEFGSTGPELLTALIPSMELGPFVKGPEVFCPVPWDKFTSLVENPCPRFTKRTFSVHFWNEMWRERGLDKNGKYHRRSFYEAMKRKHLSS